MIVTVDPQRPISGILPKNKWITEKTELDLNRNEIIRCTQFGTVYDPDMNIINTHNIDEIIDLDNKRQLSKCIEDLKYHTLDILDKDVLFGKQEETPKKEIPEEITVDNDLKIEYTLNQVNYYKEDDYTVVEMEFNTTGETISGDLYGLFMIIGTKASTLEYKSGDNWQRFNNKFANMSTLSNGDKFVFRFILKESNVSNVRYKMYIKDKSTNKELVSIQNEI